MSKNVKRYGLCKLTGEEGQFVESHIIPGALSRPPNKTRGITQIGIGYKDMRRWNSWYDTSMVTAKGEIVLRDIDTQGIAELRRKKLIWSSWGSMISLQQQRYPIDIKLVEGVDTYKLRLLFLSILWRSANTTLHEFNEIRIPEGDNETLRKMIISKDIKPLDFYPMNLVQLSTKSVWHNPSPIAETMPLLNTETFEVMDEVPIFRFFIDGLIVHFHSKINKTSSGLVDTGIFVGGTDHILVTVMPFEMSRQHIDMAEIITGWLGGEK